MYYSYVRWRPDRNFLWKKNPATILTIMVHEDSYGSGFLLVSGSSELDLSSQEVLREGCYVCYGG